MDKIELAIEVIMREKGYVWIEERQDTIEKGWHTKEEVVNYLKN